MVESSWIVERGIKNGKPSKRNKDIQECLKTLIKHIYKGKSWKEIKRLHSKKDEHKLELYYHLK